MSLTQFTEVLRDKKGSLFLAGIFVAALAFFVTTISAPRFKVTTDFMVVQANTTSQDFYTLFKSSEYLGKVLSESMTSERFINAVIETGKVDKNFLPTEKRERLNAWRDMVGIEKNIELGMLSVVVKANTDREATKVMQGISEVLITKNVEFRGGEDKAVEIRILTGPITERNPEPKELALVILTGFLAGATLMTARVTVRAISRGF